MGGITKKDLGSFIDSPIETRRRLFSEGRVTNRMRPTQITLRLPAAQIEWLKRRVEGNVNYAISKMLEKSISELNEKLSVDDFDIDDFWRGPEKTKD